MTRSLPFSLPRPSWWKRLGFAVFLLAGIAVCWAGSGLALWLQVSCCGVLLVVGAMLLRQTRGEIFGPVLIFDLLRTGRQRRYFVLRGLYALALFLIILWVYRGWTVEQDGILGIRRTAAFAASFFYTTVWLQFLAVVLLTPVYVAGAIAGEKERGTLEYLLATDLEDREIILSKLVARLLHLLYLLLAALPVLALMEFLGGVDPQLVLGSFVLNGLMMITLGSLSLLVSVYARRLIDAVFWTYFWAGVYLFLSWWLSGLVPLFCWAFFGTTPQTVTCGNPLTLVTLLEEYYPTSPSKGHFLFALVQDYTFSHCLLTVFFTALAIEKLRVVALKPEASPASPWRSPGFEFPPRRRRKRLLDQPPMFWKEVHGDALLGSARLGAFILYFQMVAGWCLVPSLCVGMLGTRDPNATIRMASTVFSAVMLLTVAASAAGTVSGERERGTLETLLSMPLEREDILYAKCLGAILSVRLIWWCLGAIWLVGFLFLGLNLCAVPLLVLAWWSHAAVFACLGLCFSLVCSTSLRATLWTLVTVFVLAIGLRLMGTYGEVLLTGWMPRDLARFVVLLCRDGLAPFASLDALALGWNAFDSHHAQLELMKTAMVGVMYYFAAAWLLWLLARWLFSRVATNVNYV